MFEKLFNKRQAKTENIEEIIPVVPAKVADNIIDIDIMSVKNLQIGYQAETLYLKKSSDDQLHIHEFIGNTAYEYLGKITANRFKTTVRYGRREEVNRDNYVEIYIPDAWNGEISLSTQYGQISTEENWKFERFTAETSEGNIIIRTLEAPRIRLVAPNASIVIEHAIGYADLHSMSGTILAKRIDGGAKLETSSGPIEATFTSANNQIESNTVNADIVLTLPTDQGLNVDGISKRGEIETDREGLELKTKPGNIKVITGRIGEKPFQNVKISTINGNVNIH